MWLIISVYIFIENTKKLISIRLFSFFLSAFVREFRPIPFLREWKSPLSVGSSLVLSVQIPGRRG